MSENQESLVVKDHSSSLPIEIGQFEAYMNYAEKICKSEMVPVAYRGKPENLLIALQYGSSIGMTPLQSMYDIVVVNGKPTISGDGAKSLIDASGKCASWEETETGTIGKEDYTVTITASRKDSDKTITRSFSVAEAKRAKLWISPSDVQKNYKLGHSPWYKYQKRMIYYRALGFLVRDLFADVLRGLGITEEVRDYDTLPTNTEVKSEQSENAVKAVTDVIEKNKGIKSVSKETSASDKVEAEEAEIVPESEGKPAQAEDKASENEAEDKSEGSDTPMPIKDAYERKELINYGWKPLVWYIEEVLGYTLDDAKEHHGKGKLSKVDLALFIMNKMEEDEQEEPASEEAPAQEATNESTPPTTANVEHEEAEVVEETVEEVPETPIESGELPEGFIDELKKVLKPTPRETADMMAILKIFQSNNMGHGPIQSYLSASKSPHSTVQKLFQNGTEEEIINVTKAII